MVNFINAISTEHHTHGGKCTKKGPRHATITGPMCFCCFNGFIRNTRESDKVWEGGRVNRDKISASMSMSFTFCAVNTHTLSHLDRQNLVLCILNIYLLNISAPLSLGLTDMQHRQTDRYMYVQTIEFPLASWLSTFLSLSLPFPFILITPSSAGKSNANNYSTWSTNTYVCKVMPSPYQSP